MFKFLSRTYRTSKRLKAEAIERGLCEQWQGEWSDSETIDSLAKKFIRGQDFAIKHNWPTPEYIESHFTREECRRNGVYVNDYTGVWNPKQRTLILMGNTELQCHISGLGAHDIYVRHDSRMRIYATEDARVFISIYDNAPIEVYADEDAKVCVYLHGGSVAYSEGNVIIRHSANEEKSNNNNEEK